jgi:hypothetical protein
MFSEARGLAGQRRSCVQVRPARPFTGGGRGQALPRTGRFPCTGMTGAPAKIVASASGRQDILRLCFSTAGASRAASLALLLLRERRRQVGQLTDVLIPSLLVPVQPLLPGLGDVTPGHRVHDVQTRIPGDGVPPARAFP